MTVKYLSKEYIVTDDEHTDYIELQPANEQTRDKIRVKRGTPRYCAIFGGEPISVDTSVPDSILIKPEIQLLAGRESEASQYGTGFIVNLVDKLCDIVDKEQKLKYIEKTIEQNPEKEAGIMLMLYCHYYRRDIPLYSDDIKEIINSQPIGSGSYENEDIWVTILSSFKELFVDEPIDKDDVATLFQNIEAEDRKFFVYALARWESMATIGITNRQLKQFLFN